MGPNAAFVGAALILPVTAFLLGRLLFRLDSGARVPVVEIGLLRSLPIFRFLPVG